VNPDALGTLKEAIAFDLILGDRRRPGGPHRCRCSRQRDHQDLSATRIVCVKGLSIKNEKSTPPAMGSAQPGSHDRRGHGRSSQVADGHDLDHYADDLAAVTAHLDFLKNGDAEDLQIRLPAITASG
jgi:hypothetical protein